MAKNRGRTPPNKEEVRVDVIYQIKRFLCMKYTNSPDREKIRQSDPNTYREGLFTKKAVN